MSDRCPLVFCFKRKPKSQLFHYFIHCQEATDASASEAEADTEPDIKPAAAPDIKHAAPDIKAAAGSPGKEGGGGGGEPGAARNGEAGLTR